MLDFRSNGTFTYTSAAGSTVCGGTFTYLVNGTDQHTATITQCDASTSSAAGCTLQPAPVVADVVFTSSVATRYASPPPGVLVGVTSNPSGLALTAVGTGFPGLNPDGSFIAAGPGDASMCAPLGAAAPTGAKCANFAYQAAELARHAEQHRQGDGRLPAGLSAERSGLRRAEPAAGQDAGQDHRLSLDHRGRPHVLDRSPLPGQFDRPARRAARRRRPGPGPTRRLRSKASATTSTPPTCRWWRRAASARSRAKRVRRSAAKPRSATSATASAATASQKDRARSEGRPSRPEQALLHLDPAG